MVNAYIVEGEGGKPAIEKHDYQDIAIAVSSPKGLVVPVLRNTEHMSFADVESGDQGLRVRAKDGKLGLDEMQGGTFTITNGGIFGSLISTPILNPPQSAILGMHGIKKRAVEHPDKPGEIALRPMMYLALSYDHRIVDGADAVRFLVHIKDAIEDPKRCCCWTSEPACVAAPPSRCSGSPRRRSSSSVWPCAPAARCGRWGRSARSTRAPRTTRSRSPRSVKRNAANACSGM
jgi:hypothetical protein